MQIFRVFHILIASLFINTGPVDGIEDAYIVINNGNFIINKINVAESWKYNLFISALGDVERVDSIYPRIDNYDSKGIMLWREKMDTAVTQVRVVFREDTIVQYELLSRGNYKGVVMIEGNRISGNTSLTELKKQLPQYHFRRKYGYNYGLYKNIHIFAHYDEPEKKLLFLSIRDRCE